MNIGDRKANLVIRINALMESLNNLSNVVFLY